MRRTFPLALIALVWSPPLAAPAAAQADSAPAPAPAPAATSVLEDSLAGTMTGSQSAFRAVGQVAAINVLVNRFDAWALKEWWARPRWQHWKDNVRFGWVWDEDNFVTNMFAHPYHGGMYFNAGRANGLDFWESAPLALLGSWTWEYFGEKNRPSLNDFFMTSFGGIGLGEMFHRLSASIRDNTRHGAARTWREIAALPFDPIGGLNRLLRGEWTRHEANPAEHDPGAYLLRVQAGARLTESRLPGSATSFAAMVVDLRYGNPFLRPYRAPFDVFGVRAVISSPGGLDVLRASGRLFGKDMNRLGARHRHVFVINQRYDYIANPAQSIGGQSVEFGIMSRWRLHKSEFGLRTQAFGDVILMGALDALDVGIGERTYDFGPGGGARAEIAVEYQGVTLLALYGQTEFVHTVSGASADHSIAFAGAELYLPLAGHVGLSVHGTHFSRVSRYTDRPLSPTEARDFPELRVLVTWTSAVRPRAARK
jgi:hypothetical protein